MVPSHSGMGLPAAGEVLGGKYVIGRVLGRGGMGVVYEARHQKLQQSVAVKVLREDLLDDRESTARFEREARAAARLSSPHTARIYDVDATPAGVPYIVMEYLEGHDLAATLTARGGALPVAEAVDWVLQACAAMAEAHAAGIVHRDLKPSNLFAAENVANAPLVKVLDFGISKITIDHLEENLTSDTTVLGTPHYMAPEQVTAGKVDGRTDLWALSVILYRALTGELPFQAPTATALAVAIATEPPTPIADRGAALPPELAQVVMAGLSKRAEDRPASVQALAAAIAPFGSGRFGIPKAPTPSSPGLPRTTPPTSTARMPRTPPGPVTPPPTSTARLTAPSRPAAPADPETGSTWGRTAPPTTALARGRTVLVALAAGLALGLLATAGVVGYRRATAERLAVEPPTPRPIASALAADGPPAPPPPASASPTPESTPSASPPRVGVEAAPKTIPHGMVAGARATATSKAPAPPTSAPPAPTTKAPPAGSDAPLHL